MNSKDESFLLRRMMRDNEILTRLERIEATLAKLVSHNIEKENYTTAEVAEILGRAEFTVREWCRQNRVWAEKRQCGRGNSKEWIISHEELERIKNEGLLPQERYVAPRNTR